MNRAYWTNIGELEPADYILFALHIAELENTSPYERDVLLEGCAARWPMVTGPQPGETVN